MRKIARKPDRFGETHILCIQYLNTIAINKKSKPHYQKYKEISFQLLKDRLTQINSKTGKKYQKEIEELILQIQSICKEKNEAESRRVAIEFDTAKETIAEWERLDEVVEETQKQEDVLKEELRRVEEISTALSNTEEAEREYLTDLFIGERV